MVEVFRPGNIAPHSGVYRATHAQQHAEPHYVTLLFGEKTTSPAKKPENGQINKAPLKPPVRAHQTAHYLVELV
ncbi:MAG TPA: hypothetical protein VGL91_16345, partial [Acidobacteriota bacterium]